MEVKLEDLQQQVSAQMQLLQKIWAKLKGRGTLLTPNEELEKNLPKLPVETLEDLQTLGAQLKADKALQHDLVG